MLKSLTMGLRPAALAEPCTAISVVAINTPSSVTPRNMDGGGVASIIGQLYASGNCADANGVYWKGARSAESIDSSRLPRPVPPCGAAPWCGTSSGRVTYGSG